jgi:hypothetical protein
VLTAENAGDFGVPALEDLEKDGGPRCESALAVANDRYLCCCEWGYRG